ncbi:MAG: twin-arginine translocase subunit TatC, partial [Acidimicrobiia bacterium]
MTEDRPQSILTHLEELRWRLLKSFIAVVVGGVIAFIFANQLRAVLEAPFHAAAPDAELQSLAVAEKWGVLMRVGLFGGVILASPVVLYQLWEF